jgi:hypothetical protein
MEKMRPLLVKRIQTQIADLEPCQIFMKANRNNIGIIDSK